MVNNASADAWWYTLPTGWGYLRLGERHRAFAIAMSHQRHCLTFIVRSIALKVPTDEHLHHCFNYIRQQILCAADGTLEDPEWRERGQAWQDMRTTGRERVCRDWRVVEEFIDANYEEWVEYKDLHFG